MEDVQYDKIAQNEQTHFWFIARKKIILSIIQRLDSHSFARILDYGCGSGNLLITMQKNYPDKEIYGADISQKALDYCKRRGAKNLIQLNNGEPETNHFDLVTCLDVIEHIDDDLAFLMHIRQLIRDHGTLILTVPAYEFLWSGNDYVSRHKRRYTRSKLKSLLQRAGFHLKKISYFNTFLFLPIFCIVMFNRLFFPKSMYVSNVKDVQPWINQWLIHLFASEKWVLKYGSFPFGVSIIAVVTKTGQNS